MKFIEIKTLAYNLIDETDLDEQVEIIVENSINEAYSELCKKDIRLTTAFVPIINRVATLPEDIIEIHECIPELEAGDRLIGSNIITDKEGILEIIYSYIREPLTNDNDEPDLHLDLQYALANFACYKYFLYRKKVEIANGFLNNYESKVYKFEQSNVRNDIGYITFIDQN